MRACRTRLPAPDAGGKHSYDVSRALEGDDRLNAKLRTFEDGGIPTKDLSGRIATFLQINPDWLMFGRENVVSIPVGRR